MILDSSLLITILGFIGAFFGLYSYCNTNDTKLKFWTAMGHTTTAVYLILLGQLSPALAIGINALRSWLSLINISDKWMYVLITAIIAQFIAFGSLPEIITCIASILATYCFFKLEGIKMRAVLLIVCVIWIIYALMVNAYPVLLFNVVSFILICITIYRQRQEED